MSGRLRLAAFGASLAAGAALFVLWQVRRTAPAASARWPGGEVLSHFIPHAGGCAWYVAPLSLPPKVEATDLTLGKARQVVVLPNDCDGLTAVVAPDGAAALAWFDPPGADGEPPPSFLIDIARGRFRRLPAPDLSETVTLSFTPRGQPVAFGFEPNVVTETVPEGGGRRLRYRGEVYPAVDGPDGIDAMAVMQVWREPSGDDPGGWHDAARAATRCCGDAVLGAAALDEFRRLGDGLGNRDGSQRLTGSGCLDAGPQAAAVPKERFGDAIKAFAPPSGGADVSLVRLTRPSWTHALLAWSKDPTSPLAGPLAFERDGVVSPPPGPAEAASWTAADRIGVAARGGYLLIAETLGGGRPMLFDMRAGRFLWGERMATAACFWTPRDAAATAGAPE